MGTRAWILEFIAKRLKSNQPQPLTALNLRDVLNEMIDYVDEHDITGGADAVHYIEIVIKAPGNVLAEPQSGDWKWVIDEDTKSLKKYKFKNTVWVLTEEDMF